MGRFLLVLICIFLFSSCIAAEGHQSSSSEIKIVTNIVAEPEEIEQETLQLEEPLMDLQEESVMLDDSITSVPEDIQVNLKYEKYFINYDYIVAKAPVNIRDAPGLSGRVIRTARTYEKINLMETVKGEYIEKYGSDAWYHIFWWLNEEKRFGFILAPLVEKRRFQFDKMYQSIQRVAKDFENGKITYINNYKNRSGIPPRYNGSERDAYGTRRSQSAPGYFSLTNKNNFIYVEDGSLVQILDQTDYYYKVKVLNNEFKCWVPKKYLQHGMHLGEFKKAVIIDRQNQNEGVFENINNKWVLVSYTLATTGANSKYKIETPLGYYFAIERKEKFIYLNDVTKKVSGYAPYTIRFTGGTYIHGIPVNYRIKEKQKVDPGHIEYTATIGTMPLSHRCVRNYTSHAKFLYDWVEVGKTVVIVIE